mmetsp:Transcript_33433/g.40969  ORF Transcript_33433/g.40969 Transcript_33433/m.40969 type:complete len:299 (-) Transcript_33433:434-1330(-)
MAEVPVLAPAGAPSGDKKGSALKDVLSGTGGGIAQVAAGHPLDTIKVRLQTQVPGPDGKMPFAGMMDCAKKTFSHEGLGGLYKGAASPLLGAMAHNAGIFFSYGQARKFTGADVPGCELYRFFLAGALAGGTLITIVETPVDLLKIKLQAQVGKGEFEGVFDAAKKITRTHGFGGVYQGVAATWLRNIPCFGLYFFGAEFGYRLVCPPLEEHTPTQAFLGGLVGGACAGFGFWGILYPLETVRIILHIAYVYTKPILTLMAENGIATFFKGYTPSLARAVPVNSAIFCAVYSIKNMLD